MCAAVLRHSAAETDTAEAMQLGRVCHSLAESRGRMLCVPNAFRLEDKGRLELDLLVKANDRAFRIAQRVLDQDVDQPFLESLFREDNFQSVSGSAALRAIYQGTSLTYTPVHFIGAFKLDNPSLPEVHAVGLRQAVFRLTQNFVLAPAALRHSGELFLSGSVFFFNRKLAYLDVDLLSAAGQVLEDLVERRDRKGGDADLAFGFLARRDLVPSVALRLENLASSKPCEGCDARFFDVESALGAQATLDASVILTHPVGRSLFGVGLPIYGPERRYDTLKTTASYLYKLANLGCFASFSPLIGSFGFLFDANVYRLGVMYTDEKQDNAIQTQRQKQTYVFTSFYL